MYYYIGLLLLTFHINFKEHSINYIRKGINNFTYLMRSLIINLGGDDNVDINFPVLDVNGLIGKTIAVGDRASMIQLINDKNFRVSVRVGKDLVLGEIIYYLL